MASKRVLKKNVNAMIFDVLEEAYTVQLLDEKKTEKATKLIDTAADFHFDILEKINGAKTKADFAPIREEIEAKAIEFVKELNALN